MRRHRGTRSLDVAHGALSGAIESLTSIPARTIGELQRKGSGVGNIKEFENGDRPIANSIVSDLLACHDGGAGTRKGQGCPAVSHGTYLRPPSSWVVFHGHSAARPPRRLFLSGAVKVRVNAQRASALAQDREVPAGLDHRAAFSLSLLLG